MEGPEGGCEGSGRGDVPLGTGLSLAAKQKEITVTDLTEILGLSQPLVSWHLRKLRRAGPDAAGVTICQLGGSLSSMLAQGESVEAHALRERGWTISAIARHLGRNRETVRAYLIGERMPGVRAPAGPDVFGEYAAYCGQRFADDPHLFATTLFDEVRERDMAGGTRCSPGRCGRGGCGRGASVRGGGHSGRVRGHRAPGR